MLARSAEELVRLGLGLRLKQRVEVAKPYDRNSDLPDAVRRTLPEAAQTVWREIFNSALGTYDNDEGRAARVAWAGLQRAGWRKNPDGEWEQVRKANDVTGAVVGLWPAPELAEQLAIGTEPADNLHVTLAFLGEDAAELSDDARQRLRETVTTVAGELEPVEVEVTGITRFLGDEEEDAVVLQLDGGLTPLRDRLVQTLKEADLTPSEKFAFIPHLTVAYVQKDDVVQLDPVDLPTLRFEELTIALGEDREKVRLGGAETEAMKVRYAVTVQKDEKRYTFGPLYVPNTDDAHDEWIERQDLQDGLHEYVRQTGGDRKIWLQHDTSKEAGEWMEVVSWPLPAEVELKVPGQKAVKKTLPAGTCYMGVRWLPETWERVKRGELRGLSIGGTANRIEADVPDA